MRRKTTGDVLERLLRLIEEEKKKIPDGNLAPVQPTEHVELNRSYRDAFRWRRFWGGLERHLRGKPENICSLSEGLPPLTPSGWKRGIIPIA